MKGRCPCPHYVTFNHQLKEIKAYDAKISWINSCLTVCILFADSVACYYDHSNNPKILHTCVCLSVALHIVDLWQYYVCSTRSGVNRYTLVMVHYLGRVCQCGLHAVLWSHTGMLMRLLAAEPCSTTELLFVCQYFCGTILVTQYWWCETGGFQEQPFGGQMPFYWPSYSLPFCLLLFSLSLVSFYGSVLWGWGLRTDRVLIALSQHCIANFFY